MWSPTNATIERSLSTINGSTRSMAISPAKIVSITFFALSAFTASMPTQIECSEDPWVMRITLIEASERASNNLFENPGTPTIPLPSRLTRTTLLMLEIPRMMLPSFSASFLITVPCCSLAKVFFIQTGIFFINTGWIVGG